MDEPHWLRRAAQALKDGLHMAASLGPEQESGQVIMGPLLEKDGARQILNYQMACPAKRSHAHRSVFQYHKDARPDKAARFHQQIPHADGPGEPTGGIGHESGIRKAQPVAQEERAGPSSSATAEPPPKDHGEGQPNQQECAGPRNGHRGDHGQGDIRFRRTCPAEAAAGTSVEIEQEQRRIEEVGGDQRVPSGIYDRHRETIGGAAIRKIEICCDVEAE